MLIDALFQFSPKKQTLPPEPTLHEWMKFCTNHQGLLFLMMSEESMCGGYRQSLGCIREIFEVRKVIIATSGPLRVKTKVSLYIIFMLEYWIFNEISSLVVVLAGSSNQNDQAFEKVIDDLIHLVINDLIHLVIIDFVSLESGGTKLDIYHEVRLCICQVGHQKQLLVRTSQKLRLTSRIKCNLLIWEGAMCWSVYYYIYLCQWCWKEGVFCPVCLFVCLQHMSREFRVSIKFSKNCALDREHWPQFEMDPTHRLGTVNNINVFVPLC